MSVPQQSPENAFWRWSLDYYGRKPVERALLKLQDECGFDVNLALWCCWRAQTGAALSETVVTDAVEAKREWTANVVHPLRSARRHLKAEGDGNDPVVEALREQIKDAELKAEQHVQNLLFALSPPEAEIQTQPPENTALENLNVYAKLLNAEQNPAFSANLLHELVDNIFKPSQNEPSNKDG